LKIAHVITGLGRGGAESVLLQLCSASQGGDLQHTVISLTGHGEMALGLETAGVRVIELNIESPLSAVPAIWKLRGILRALDPDVVQTWMYHADLIGGTAARLAGIRALVWGIRSTVTDSSSIKRSTRVLIRASAWLSRAMPARIVVCARDSADSHARAGYRRDKMTVIQNGVDIVRFGDFASPPADWIDANGLQNDRAVLGTVARFTPQKDHENLVKALGILAGQGESFQCVLIGQSMDASNGLLKRWIGENRLEEHVVLMGPRPDIPDVMHALDIHVLSSVVEGFPNVLAEAMACGTPCVSTDAGDARHIIANKGWLVPKSDPDALAQALLDALTERRESPEVWHNRRLACRRHIEEEFSLQRMVDNYAAVWRAAAEGRAGRREG
jgi:glycosyltransferase involved in cell wall biosynthesis